LSVIPKLDIIHFGPETDLEHIESYAKKIGKEEAKEVQHLIIEYQIERASNGEVGGRRIQ
jgi:hypothetical protein